jgi:hypothetical protein
LLVTFAAAYLARCAWKVVRGENKCSCTGACKSCDVACSALRKNIVKTAAAAKQARSNGPLQTRG